MKRLITALSLFALTFVLVGPALADEEDEYEARVKRINAMAEKPGKMKTALQRIATETGMTADRIESQHKKNPEMGPAGIMLANVMSNDTKKNPGYFIEQRKSGKKWLAIAKENKIPVDRLNERLERLENAIKG
jgi:hypothetical protein